ncbi:oxygen-insensitive NADPH nitroreductase [Halalkalibacter nanhaiisediminis]|uniref:Nitroreductase n=1 Tax=Halalkalibacter nanhaiisediminis TaxID=688079 RepID=A0A562QHF0_9BACI|nr:oxygen-insensitive NADPH nitroreductase [Halalkalibacter nanhaiisediminis]TWI56161.1 nitroreductase [Halalkalibacter nanhaiisediminis]
MQQTEMIKLIQSHRSIRAFTEQKVTDAQIESIVESGRWAPSSNHVQAYSIIVIQSEERKKELAKLAGNQSYVEECPVFFVICADFYRLQRATAKHEQPFEVGAQEQVLVGAVDTALVAENMLLAARSYGMGGVMIGGIRNDPEAVSKLLGLPEFTFPVMGLCIGYPAQEPEQKPRLPKQAVVHYETYDASNYEETLAQYDEITARYYQERSEAKRVDTWSEQMSRFFATTKRPHIGDFLKKQGFLKS